MKDIDFKPNRKNELILDKNMCIKSKKLGKMGYV